MITTVCKISYGSQTVPPIVPAVQGDTGRAISFEIADFTPPAGATATYFILKPSGEAIYNSATITDNSILCELTAQSLAEAGENRMQVRVLQGEDIVTSFEVILMVRTFLGDDAIESGTEMNIFDKAVEQATEDFQTNAEQIVEEVIESIPSDYTELTEEVDELNERFDNGLDPYTNKSIWITKYAINAETGGLTANNRRATSGSYIGSGVFDTALLIDDTYEFAVFAWSKTTGEYIGAYKTDGTYGKNATNLRWMTRFDRKDDYYFRLVLRYKDLSEIDDDETFEELRFIVNPLSDPGYKVPSQYLFNGIMTPVPDIEWEQGGISLGEETEVNDRIRIKGYIPLTNDVIITGAEDIVLLCEKYNANKQYMSSSSWQKAPLIIDTSDGAKYIRVMMALASLVPITPQDAVNTWLYFINPNENTIISRNSWVSDAGIKEKAIPELWELSALSTSDGQPTSNTARLRTYRAISKDECKSVVCINDAEMLVFAYNNNGVYQGVLTANGFVVGGTPVWVTNFTLTDYDYSFKFVLRDKLHTNEYLYGTFTENVIFYANTFAMDNSSNRRYEYTGEKIDLKTHGCNIQLQLHATYESQTMNDIEFYGNYIVCGFHSNIIRLYNKTTKAFISDITIDGSSICNTICFSDEFYSENDILPLLYVRSEDNGKYNVVRIIDENTAEIVKTYKFDTQTYGVAPQAFWDFANNVVYVLASVTPTSNPFTLYAFDITGEQLDEDGTYVLPVISSKEIPNFGGRTRQGGKFYNGKIYSGCSMTASPFRSQMRVIEPQSGDTVTILDLSFLGEEEGIGIDRQLGKLYASDYYNVFELIL